MSFLADLALDVQGALADVAGPLTYRALSSFSVKAASTAAIGATTVTLGTLPATLTGVLAGDQPVSGVQARIVSADTPAAAGAIVAPITAALTAQITSGATVQVNRAIDSACSGWLERLDVTRVIGLVTAGDAAITVLCNTLAVVPRVADQVLVDGKTWTIKSIAKDPAGCAWVLQVGGG